MKVEHTACDFYDMEIIILKNELKKFVQKMKSVGYLATVDFDDSMAVQHGIDHLFDTQTL